MNLCIDQGNSSTKAGIFNQEELIESFQLRNELDEIAAIFDKYTIDSCILSSVVDNNEAIIQFLNNKKVYFEELNHKTALPIINTYSTPETLGKDRIAAVVGATFLKPANDLLVIDAGSAITYDFVSSDSVYHGGNIAPGLNMRLRSLHEFTQKLPLIEPKNETPFIGNDTNSAILSGSLYGIVLEIDGYINTLKIKYPELSVFLTGGSIFYFDTKLKSPIFAEPNLVLIGLNRILQYNVQK